MLLIQTYNEIDRAEWSALVRESATGTWFQTPEAYDFFASQPELFKPFAISIARDGRMKGICVGYIQADGNCIMQMLSARAIINGGPALADDATDEEVETLMNAVREQLKGKAIYVECRNFNDFSRWSSAFEAAGFKYQPHLNFHIDTSSVEIVEANLGKSRKRDIRTTIREGVTVKPIGDLTFKISNLEVERMVKEWYAILADLYRTKVKTPLFPLSFFLALSKLPEARFLLTEYKGRIIGGTVCVEYHKCQRQDDISNFKLQIAESGDDKSSILNIKFAMPSGVIYEWFACGEDGVYPHIFPSCYATYAGIRYAAEHGCTRFDMMGAGTPDEAYGVRDFKAKFGGTLVEHGRFLCITRPLLYKIGKLGVKILKKGDSLRFQISNFKFQISSFRF